MQHNNLIVSIVLAVVPVSPVGMFKQTFALCLLSIANSEVLSFTCWAELTSHKHTEPKTDVLSVRIFWQLEIFFADPHEMFEIKAKSTHQLLSLAFI
jgi:hypothetical protein